MELYYGIFSLVALVTLYFSLFWLLEFDAEKRILGAAMLLWLGLGVYLFFTRWIPDTRHEPYSFCAIMGLTVSGYLVGRLLGTAVRPDWAEDLRELSRR